MQVTTTDIEATFRGKTDSELVNLAATASGMTPAARGVLLRELEARLAVPRSSGSVQKRGGWYTVYLPRGQTKFPYLCPRCLRSNPEKSIRFSSNIEPGFKFFRETGKSVAVEVPHCVECARALLIERRIALLMAAPMTAAGFVVALIFDLPGPVLMVLLLALLWPAVALYSRTPTVKLGDCTETVFEFRFKKSEYATAFAAINDVAAQNADTIEEELTEAIKSVKEVAAP